MSLEAVYPIFFSLNRRKTSTETAPFQTRSKDRFMYTGGKYIIKAQKLWSSIGPWESSGSIK